MLLNLAIAALMILMTTIIHAGGMILAVFMIKHHGRRHLRHLALWTHIRWLTGIVLIMFLASLLEVLVWAVTYLMLNATQGFEQSVYFSMVTYTTLGYGDITLDEGWRLLSSFEAANGIIMFGWTTAIVVAAVQQIYFSRKPGAKK